MYLEYIFEKKKTSANTAGFHEEKIWSELSLTDVISF